MTGFEPFAKVLGGMIAKPLSKKVKDLVLGPEDVNAMTEVCDRTLRLVIERTLQPYDIDRTQLEGIHDVVQWMLSASVGIEPEDRLFDPAARPGLLEDLVEQLRSSPAFDPDSLQVVSSGEIIPVDLVRLIGNFLDELPAQIQAEAQRHGSALGNFATQQQLSAIRSVLEGFQATTSRLLRTNGRTVEQIRAGAIRRMRFEIDRRRAGEFGEALFVTSTAWDTWEEYRTSERWATSVVTQLRDLSENLSRLPGLRHHIGKIDSLDVGAPYLSLTAAIRRLPLPSLHADIQTLLAEDANPRRTTAALSRDHVYALRSARNAVRWLRREALEPHYQHCFCCVGSFGSGRSRLLTEIADHALETSSYALFLTFPNADAPLEATICGLAGTLFESEFATMNHLGDFLRHELDADLYLLIDDIDEPARSTRFVSDLVRTIEMSTAAPRLRWAMTADHRRWESLTPVGVNDGFWPRYCFAVNEASGPEGWLDLDTVNISDRVGYQVLESVADETALAELRTIMNDPRSFRYEAEVISNPLVAWLRATTERNHEMHPQRLADIHATQFIQSYWRRRIASSGATEDEADAMDESVALLSRRYMAGDYRRLPVALALRLLASEGISYLLQDPPSARGILLRLCDVGVLLKWREGDAELGGRAEYVAPRFEALWGYRIARPLVAGALESRRPREAFLLATKAWRGVAAPDSLEEATCEIALRLMSQNNLPRRELRETWEQWLTDARTAQGPAWLAAVASPTATQDVVAQWLNRTAVSPGTKRELFSLLRLLAGARSPTWMAQQRLKAVQPSYERIGREGLSGYLIWTVWRLVTDPELCTDQNYVTVARCLVGTEKAGVADSASRAITTASEGAFRTDLTAWLVNVMRFFQGSSDTRHASEFPRSPKTRGSRGDAGDIGGEEPHLDYFWQHLAREASRHAVRKQGLDSFELLAQVGWYVATRSGVATHVARRLQAEANVALGAWFQRHPGDDDAADAYVELISRLVSGTGFDAPRLDQREIAFFLIRHSTGTSHRPRVRVDARFHGALEVLCRDGDLMKRVHWLQPTCEVNGIV